MSETMRDDLYKELAATSFGVPYEDVTKEQRQIAKATVQIIDPLMEKAATDSRVKYETLTPRTFTKTGELPKGTRRVQILIDRPAGMLFGHYRVAEAEKIIEDNYARGKANFPTYYLVRDETKRMDAETVAELAALTEEKRIKKLADEAALDADNAVASAELKDQEAK